MISDYGQLKAIVADWMDRKSLLDPVTLNNRTYSPMDVFVSKVEAECNRKLRTEDMVTAIFNSGCDDQTFILLPDNILGMRLVTVNQKDADYLTPEQFTEAETLYCGKPFYTRIANQIHVYPEMAAADDLTIIAYVTVPPLIKETDTNWMLRKFSDVYQYGMLFMAYSYVYDLENEAKNKALFEQAINDLILTDSDDRWSGSTMRIRNA